MKGWVVYSRRDSLRELEKNFIVVFLLLPDDSMAGAHVRLYNEFGVLLACVSLQESRNVRKGSSRSNSRRRHQ